MKVETEKRERTCYWEGDGLRPGDNIRSCTYIEEIVTKVEGFGKYQKYAETFIGRSMSSDQVIKEIEYKQFQDKWSKYVSENEVDPPRGINVPCALVPGKKDFYIVCDPGPRIVDDYGNHIILILEEYEIDDLAKKIDECLKYAD